MKPLLLLLGVSLAGNAAIAVALLRRSDNESAAASARASAAVAAPAAATARQAAASPVLAEGPRELWSALQTDDLRALIARLRAAGFPPEVIRAMVEARIGAQFAERMRALTREVADTPYWRPAPTSSLRNPKLFEERQQIYRDRARLLRELLGTEGIPSEEATAQQRRQYGDLPRAKIDLIDRINEDYAEMSAQVRGATQGIVLPEDRDKLALLEREKRADLATVLSPAELAGYEMRTSPVTARLRTALTLMDASEQEFRALYALYQPVADILYPNRGNLLMPTTSAMLQERRDVTAQVEARLGSVLGGARAAEFVRASNSEFQQFNRLAQAQNLPPAAAVQAYELRNRVSTESARIGSDQNLSNEQKRAAMQTLAQNAQAQFAAALGPAGDAYARSADWLRAIGTGSVVTFQGTTTSYRPLPNSTTPLR